MLPSVLVLSASAREINKTRCKSEKPSLAEFATICGAIPIFDEGDGACKYCGVVKSFRRNEEIYGEGEPADYLYKVLDGGVRKYKLLNDGRRQIGGFYFTNGIFGLESNETHGSSADALTTSRILFIKRSRLFQCVEANNSVARNFWSMTASELKRSEQQALLLVKSARERVASFLLDMAQHSDSDTIELLMPREDIADYLGLTIETVSRILNQLSIAGIISVAGARRITLRNRSVICALSRGETETLVHRQPNGPQEPSAVHVVERSGWVTVHGSGTPSSHMLP